MCWNFVGRGVGECVFPPELEEDVSELDPLVLCRLVLCSAADREERTGDAVVEASLDMLNRLASFRSGDGLPGLWAAAAAIDAGVESMAELPGGEMT